MTYRIARNGEVFGPYTLEQVQQYMASGNIVTNDLVQAEGAAEWLPISQLFPLASVAEPPVSSAVPSLYPDPPDLPWWAALLADVLSGGLFFTGWNIYTSAWLKKIDSASTALYFYIAEGVLALITLSSTYHSVAHWIWGAPVVYVPHSISVGLLTWTIRLIARFVFRTELLRHFNGPEPIGLRLDGFLTFFFGGLYFQYKFNEINRLKRMLQVSVPAV